MRGRHRLLVGILGGFVAFASTIAMAAPASAHPLGNFTVNRYARVELSAGVARVYYVLDEAEIPAFQDRDAVASDPAAFADRRARAIASGLSLTVDGAAVPLTVAAQSLSQPMGQGGLHTLRLAIRYDGALPQVAGPLHAVFSDGNEPDRVGWRELVVVARGDARIETSNAPARDVSDELRKYPTDLIRSPLDLRQATFSFRPGTVAVSPAPLSRTTGAVSRAGGSFAKLVTRTHLTPLVLAGMLLGALLFGAVHALAPGHGKTVMAAYLVGTRGRMADAVLLGTIVSLMHTGSVLVLGLVLFHVSRTTSLEKLYPVLTLVGGLAVVAVGAGLLRSRLRTLRHTREHAHGHSHTHSHGPHTHSHELPAGVSPLSRRGLIVLAGAGGILPSPSAVIVLVSA
ncbi:MAG TPA: hypothetical protein VFA83_16180, partial [Acidimicrobiales bacterium]|nr:hypothetical protein [Acidimicrobiales bacterium]